MPTTGQPPTALSAITRPSRRCCALALAALLTTAKADPYDYVLMPYFEPGQLQTRASWGAQDLRDGHAAGESLALGYAPTSYWYTEVWGAWDTSNGSPNTFDGSYWTNEFALPSDGRADWALATTYWKPNFAHSGYSWTVGPMFQFAAEHFDLNLNLFASHWFWPAQGGLTTLSYQAQIKTLMAPGWEWGAQAFGDLGRFAHPQFGGQSQQWGPALFGHQKLGPGSVHCDLALLAGLTRASPRATLRADLAYSF